MASRHLSRSIAMQALYEWDFWGRDNKRLPSIVKRNKKEIGPGIEEGSFIDDIVKGVIKHIKKIDEIIEQAAPAWPLEQVAIIDRNVLRVGIYELLWGNRKDVPPKVAINEAIEIAKRFGGENAGKFINGVLGTIYREIGEPGKDQESTKKAATETSKPRSDKSEREDKEENKK